MMTMMMIDDEDDDGDGDHTQTPTKNTAQADKRPCALATSLFFSSGCLSRPFFLFGFLFPFFPPD
jgi:hypothetical protein